MNIELKEYIANIYHEINILLNVGDDHDEKCHNFNSDIKYATKDNIQLFDIKYVCTNETSDAIINQWLSTLHLEVDDNIEGKYSYGLDIDRVKYCTGIRIEFNKIGK